MSVITPIIAVLSHENVYHYGLEVSALGAFLALLRIIPRLKLLYQT